MNVLTELLCELFEDQALPLGELSRHLNRDLDALIASPEACPMRNPLAFDAQYGAWLSARWYPHLALSVERRQLDIAAERGMGERNGNGAHDVIPVASKEQMRSHMYEHLEVARGAIGPHPIAGAAHQPGGTLFDAGGNGHGNRLARLDQTAGATRGTRVTYAAPRPAALRAGALDGDREQPLLQAHPATPVARGAIVGNRPHSRPRPLTVSAGHDAVVAHGLVASESRLLEGNLDFALDVAFVAAPNAEDPEQIAEEPVHGNVADVDEATREGSAGTERRAGLFGAMPKSIVHGSTVFIGKHLIREIDLLEALVRRRVALMAIGMALSREFLERALNLLGGGVAMDSEDLVVVPLRHASTGLTSILGRDKPLSTPYVRTEVAHEQ